ncbi:MAG: sulfate adenylyltransferase subunit CysN [Desulfuromonadales bacterium]|nr:sulfate adenylyltransferase subunit CysN [Desulfuromonadales bacterium]
MAHQSELIAEDIHAYLKVHEEKSMLRFITCGSVDDGKSTLIGRLLWDSKMVFEDQLATLEADSKRVGTQGDKIDYALLLDGLQAEREQGITIDVAYRFFSTEKRKFIVADTPGHEQYTRNMVTGASTAQSAVILIDARKGVLTQTRRHSYLVSLVGIRHVVLAINKMDLVDYSEERFNEILAEYKAFATGLGFASITAIPISALEGDNVLEQSDKTGWYSGPTLMEYLETVEIDDAADNRPFRMRVQWVNRPNLDFRGFCGTVASGVIRPGDAVVVTSSGQKSRIARIVTMDGDLPQAQAGQAITLTLVDEIDISRGDLFAAPEALPANSDRFETRLVWMHEESLLPGRSYLLKSGSTTVQARITAVNARIDVNTLQQESGGSLALNEVGLCTIQTDRPIPFDPYKQNRNTGSFILIDRYSNATVGAGMVDAANVSSTQKQDEIVKVDREARASRKDQSAKVLWFNGSNRVDASAIATAVERQLYRHGEHTYLINDQTLRGLNSDLDSATVRPEIVRRAAEVARLMVDAGLVVLVALDAVEPGLDELRSRFEENSLIEIHLGGDASSPGEDGTLLTVDGEFVPAEKMADQVVKKLRELEAANKKGNQILNFHI